MTKSNAPYVSLYELIERSAKGRRHGTRRELRVMAWRGMLGAWTDRPNELNNQIQNTLAMKPWSVEFSTVYWICTTGSLRLPGANSAYQKRRNFKIADSPMSDLRGHSWRGNGHFLPH